MLIRWINVLQTCPQLVGLQSPLRSFTIEILTTCPLPSSYNKQQHCLASICWNLNLIRPIHYSTRAPNQSLGVSAATAHHHSRQISSSNYYSFYSSSNTSSSDSSSNTDNTNTNDRIILSKRNGLSSLETTQQFLSQLTESQKLTLFNTLNLELLRKKYQDELGHYLTKLGRPTSIHQDPTGTLSEVSPTWLQNKLATSELEVPSIVQPILEEEVKGTPPSGKDIWAVGVKNAIPFVGFGFLDNLIMILAGDYIDVTIGTTLAISTMAAAALGNTISDVAGIASAWYVERVAEKIGIHSPVLTAFQFASWQIRWVTNIGRALGVTIGCLLGMIPLAFLNTKSDSGGGGDEKSTPPNSSSSTTVEKDSTSTSSQSNTNTKN